MSFHKKKNMHMALGNNNYIGYVSPTLVQCKVRFIEVAIVCLVWTSLICFYLEEERGHLMKEGMHAARHRMGVRGNNFSFLMPWEDIMDSLRRVGHTKELPVPHSPEVLAHVVRLYMEIGGDDAEVAKFSKEIKVHTHVVLTLGRGLIESHHQH